jgi:hypothetical protein
MDLSTLRQIIGLLDPSLIPIEKLSRAGWLPSSRSSDGAALPVLDQVHAVSISFFGSKRSPFFQTANVVAEIFRA